MVCLYDPDEGRAVVRGTITIMAPGNFVRAGTDFGQKIVRTILRKIEEMTQENGTFVAVS